MKKNGKTKERILKALKWRKNKAETEYSKKEK